MFSRIKTWRKLHCRWSCWSIKIKRTKFGTARPLLQRNARHATLSLVRSPEIARPSVRSFRAAWQRCLTCNPMVERFHRELMPMPLSLRGLPTPRRPCVSWFHSIWTVTAFGVFPDIPCGDLPKLSRAESAPSRWHPCVDRPYRDPRESVGCSVTPVTLSRRKTTTALQHAAQAISGRDQHHRIARRRARAASRAVRHGLQLKEYTPGR